MDLSQSKINPDSNYQSPHPQRKKRFLIIGLVFFLAAAFFALGIFAANEKIKKLKIAETLNSTKEILEKEVTGTKEKTIGNENNIAPEPPKEEELNNETINSDITDTAAEENSFSFGVIGDTQYYDGGSSGGFPNAVRQLKTKNVDLVMAEGDLVSSCSGGCDAKYVQWKSVFGSLAANVYPTQGNHDRTGKDKADASWQNVFSLPTNGPAGYSELTYSFDYKNTHFVVLDSEKPKENEVNDTQRNWLDQDLTKNTKENTFVFFHEPAYPTNSKIDESLDVNKKDRDALWNILTRHKVTAVFVGHEHINSRRRVNGLYQFGFGNTQSFNHDAPKPGQAEYSYVGQNFGVVKINGQSITVEVYATDGRLLNSFAF